MDEAVKRSALHAVKLGVSQGVALGVRALAATRDHVEFRRSTVTRGAAPPPGRATAIVFSGHATPGGPGPIDTRTQAGAAPAPSVIHAAAAPLVRPATLRMAREQDGQNAAPARLKVEMLPGGRAAESRVAAPGAFTVAAPRSQAPAAGGAVASRAPVAAGHGGDAALRRGVDAIAVQVTGKAAKLEPGRKSGRQASGPAMAAMAPPPLPTGRVRRDGWKDASWAITPARAAGPARSAAPAARYEDGPTQQPAYTRDVSQSQPSAVTPRRANADGGENVNPDANSATGSGPTQGDVFLDGTLVGRWLARDFAEAAARPANGSASFDPRRDVFPTGTMIGG